MDEPFSALDVLTAETLRTDLLDLWIEGRMPIHSMLMVTHNIEEAVLMSDRILVFASNPGRIMAEVTVDLPQPRSRLVPAFRALVDDIYERMTARAARDGATAPREGLFPGVGIAMILPHVSTNLLAGLAGAVNGPPYHRVREVAPQADPATRTFQVKVGLTKPPEAMRLGATVTGTIQLGSAPAIEVPASALTEASGRPAVWLVDPTSQTVSLRNIDVARYEPNTVVVSQGLEAGEIVVTAGVQALRPGQKVRLLGACHERL